jgi:hypothetical protein
MNAIDSHIEHATYILKQDYERHARALQKCANEQAKELYKAPRIAKRLENARVSTYLEAQRFAQSSSSSIGCLAHGSENRSGKRSAIWQIFVPNAVNRKHLFTRNSILYDVQQVWSTRIRQKLRDEGNHCCILYTALS